MSGRRQSPNPKPPPGAWAERANCIGLPASWFFPEKGDAESGPSVRAICAACVVRTSCLDYAMSEPLDITGWWGGTSPRERVAMRRQQRRSA